MEYKTNVGTFIPQAEDLWAFPSFSKINFMLYHLTKERYLQSIFSQGLLINSHKTGFCNKSTHKIYKEKFGMQPIFLTDNYKYVVENMLGNAVKIEKYVLLSVDIELTDDNHSVGWFYCSGDNILPAEFRYLNNIPPSKIKFIKNLY